MTRPRWNRLPLTYRFGGGCVVLRAYNTRSRVTRIRTGTLSARGSTDGGIGGFTCTERVAHFDSRR